MQILVHRIIAAMAPILGMLALSAGLMACSDHVDPSEHGIVFSPNGKPLSGGFLGHPNCEQALGGWYDHLTRTGPLTATVFVADARRQFREMDLDHLGLLTPAELSHYRLPYVYATDASGKGGKAYKRDREKEAEDERRGGNHDSSDDLADPVMSADRRNRNEVDLADFLIYARQNFARLDMDHDGQLSRDELLASCPQ